MKNHRKRFLMAKIKTIPYHLGIILDGNRRWAKEKNLPAFEGHKKGLEKVRELIKWCQSRGVKVLTLFVFSTENWKRKKNEVSFLMKLVQKAIADNLKELQKQGIKVRAIGQMEKLSKPIRASISEAERLTENNKDMMLNFALSYGGRAEIVEAFKRIMEKKIAPDKITEDTVSQNLWTSDLDLIIRTGKEQRISNFLIWQAAYSELYFCPKYWPDFTEQDLGGAFSEYASRQRRFGR